MNDRTIPRASRRGTHTLPVDKPRAKRISSDMKLYPDEIALAVEMARNERVERDIRAYEIRKRDAE